MNMKKLFLLNFPYLLFVYPFNKLAQAFRLAPGADLSGKLLSIGDGFTAALSSPWLSFHPTDLLIGIAGAVILRMAVYLKGKNAKKILPDYYVHVICFSQKMLPTLHIYLPGVYCGL